ncbi:MAG: DUF4232 domain-containing protein [Chloroflexi bacterium]|nr:MAG: DUF4232 domain-containing protein [Chloroflexota bacterium]
MARCTAGVLRGAIVVLGAAAGNIYGRLVVFNAGQECTLFGFSGLQLVDANGTVLPTNAVWDLPPAPSLVTLPNNGLAVANLQWGDVPGVGDNQSGPCQPQPATLRIIPPDETQQFNVAWPGGPVCQQGRIQISAYYAP